MGFTAATVGIFASSVKAPLPKSFRHHSPVKTDAARVLADNLRALMNRSAELPTQKAVAKRSGMDQTTVGRILNCKHSPTLKQIDGLADAFGLLPWQLLVPSLDATNPPVVVLTSEERQLYDRLTTAAESIASYKK